MQDCISTIEDFDDCPHEEFVNFISEFCQDCDNFTEINEKIIEVEVKNSFRTKIAKKTLQIYAFVYKRIMDFPQNTFDYETLTTNDLFVYVHKIINVKIHIHHWHVTGKIKGYAHDFCNEKVRENKNTLSCVVHNLFGFDIYFLIKGIRLLVSETKDVNIGGTGLTNINYGLLLDMKLIDTMKYFLTSLGKLASTTDSIEKKRIKKLTKQFLNSHHYFSGVWNDLTLEQQNSVLEIVIGKGVILYEKIIDLNSLHIRPKDGICFSKDEFFSTLQDKAVDEEAYENSKTSFILLKMRDLLDLNDLHNAQDVILHKLSRTGFNLSSIRQVTMQGS